MFKKALTLAVVLTTIVWTMGVAAFIPVASAATLAAGDLIKGTGPAVYYYAADGKRYTFPTEATYFSWYADFSGVKTITNDELAAISLAGNIVVRPGTKLVKITSVPKVFAVEPQGKLTHVASEAAASALYGAGWASRVIDIPDGFWVNYTDTGVALDGTKYPAGQLVKKSGTSDTYYMDTDGKARKVATEAAFSANRWKWTDVITAPASMTFTMGAEISGYTASLVDTSQGGGAAVVPQTGGALTVSLALNSPASRVVPKSTPVEMVRFNLSAGSKDVSITSLKLKQSGLADWEDVNEVTLYVAGDKTGTTKNINSDREASFNFSTPVVISANSSKEVVVKATLANDGYYALGINAATDILSNASSVSGSFPLVGNTMNAATTSATIGTLTFNADDNDNNAQVGEDNVTAVEFTAAADNEEDIYFRGLTLKNNGTLKGSEVGTMTLFHDGTEIDTATMGDDKYVTFSFDALKIAKGETEDFKVEADFEAGSNNDTLQLYVKDAVDVDAYGGSYGYQSTIVKTAFDTDDADSTLITLTAGDLVINFDKTAVPAANIKIDTDNIVVGNLEMTANSETIKITDLKLDFTFSGLADGDIENVELVDLATGGIIDLTLAAGKYGTDEEIELLKGVKKEWNVRLDTLATAGDGETLAVTLAGSDITAEGDVSGSSVTDITPASITGRTMTVVASDLTHTTKTLNATDVVAGATDVSAYKAELKAASASNVKITKVVVDATDSSTFNSDDVTEAKLVVNGNVVDTVSGSKISAAGVLTFDGFTTTVPKSMTYTMYVKVSFASTVTDLTPFTMVVTEITAKDEANDSVPVTEDSTAGPTVTVAASGTLEVTVNGTEVGANHDIFTTAGSTSGLIGAMKFDAAKEAAKVKDLTLLVDTSNATLAANVVDSVATVQIVDSNKSTVIGSTSDLSVNGANDVVIFFDDWNYLIPEAGVKTVYLRLVTNEIGPGVAQTAVSGSAIILSVSAITAEGNDSGDDYTVTNNGGVTKEAIIVAARPTSIVNDLSNGTLSNGQGVIGKFKFTVENNGNQQTNGEAAQFDLGVATLSFSLAGATIGDGGAGADLRIYWASDTSTKVTVSDVAATPTTDAIDLSALGQISGTDTLIIEAVNIAGAGAAGDYIQVKFDDLSGDISWDDQVGSAHAEMRLDYDYVTGGTLSN